MNELQVEPANPISNPCPTTYQHAEQSVVTPTTHYVIPNPLQNPPYSELQVDSLAKNYRTYLICWNCKDLGHAYHDCTSQFRNVFCYGCGTANTYKPNCLKCKTEKWKASAYSPGNVRSATIPLRRSTSPTPPQPTSNRITPTSFVPVINYTIALQPSHN